MTSVRIGDRVLSWCDDGLLVAEYALFDVSETLLHAADPVSVREAGYMTTARQALERLAREGVTPALADDAARALPIEVASSYARGPTTRELIEQLGAHELFDGAVYRAQALCYEGMWLNLRALSAALPAGTSLLLQALHLASALSEVPGAMPVHLSTSSLTRDGRPGERTWHKVSLGTAANVPRTLKRLAPRAGGADADPRRERRVQQALLARVRERMLSESPPPLRLHLALLEQMLVAQGTMAPGVLDDAELKNVERLLDGRDVHAAEEQIARLEVARGPTPGVRYLRARALLIRGGAPPEVVARELSRLADEHGPFHEAALGAARSWLAAGDGAHARHFARRLSEDPSVTDSQRLVALEILESTSPTSRSTTPPPVERPSDDEPRRAAPLRVPLLPSLGDVPLPEGAPPAAAPSLPPAAAAAPRPPRARPSSLERYEPELVESLCLPFAASESDLGNSQVPKTPLQARIAMTRLARDLARDYRLAYGKALRCDVMAIDAMQRHLTNRFAHVAISEPDVAWELRRHGALLSEIVARSLGGDWVDISPSEPGYWAMLVAPTTRTRPIGRVYRFVALGHRERDLVSYYLDLEGLAQGFS